MSYGRVTGSGQTTGSGEPVSMSKPTAPHCGCPGRRSSYHNSCWDMSGNYIWTVVLQIRAIALDIQAVALEIQAVAIWN